MKAIDLSGNRYYSIVVLKRVPTPIHIKRKASFFECLCNCGNKIIAAGSDLKKGSHKSCGCTRFQRTTFEYREHPLYDVWKGMRARCNGKNNIGYKNYGGRGIRVCERWNDFLKFWEDMEPTYKHGLQLDRVNNDGHYEPSNCRWLTPKENGRKTRRTKLSLTLANDIRSSNLKTKELANKYNVCKATIHHIKQGRIWS